MDPSAVSRLPRDPSIVDDDPARDDDPASVAHAANGFANEGPRREGGSSPPAAADRSMKILEKKNRSLHHPPGSRRGILLRRGSLSRMNP